MMADGRELGAAAAEEAALLGVGASTCEVAAWVLEGATVSEEMLEGVTGFGTLEVGTAFEETAGVGTASEDALGATEGFEVALWDTTASEEIALGETAAPVDDRTIFLEAADDGAGTTTPVLEAARGLDEAAAIVDRTLLSCVTVGTAPVAWTEEKRPRVPLGTAARKSRKSDQGSKLQQK
jgi:hypothetical protein